MTKAQRTKDGDLPVRTRWLIFVVLVVACVAMSQLGGAAYWLAGFPLAAAAGVFFWALADS